MASIKQLDDRRFKITVSNGYRPDGKKICKAKTIRVPENIPKRGIRQYVAHEAEELERQFKTGYSEDGDMTFQEFAERWLSRQVRYAPSTLESYRRMLGRVYPFIGSIPINRLRPIALENMLVELRKRTYRGRPIGEATVQKYLTVVSAVLSDAKRNEIIQKNPARMIDLPETESAQQQIPTEEEALRFLNYICNEEIEYRTYYVLAIYTGCRRGELCALKWEDFLVDSRDDTSVLTVSRSRSVVPGKGVVEGPTKNGHSRVIAISSEITRYLQSYCCMKMAEAEERGEEVSDYLFVNNEGHLFHPDTFTKHLRMIYEELGFPKEYHLHTLRHYFVTTLLHHGVDKQTVAELAGHGDTSFLERTYCHPQLALKQQAASIMEDSLLHQQAG
jgi:integrase